MIKYRHIIEKDQTRIGNLEVVRMRVRNPLGPSSDAVAEESDRSAEKRLQILFVVDAERPQLLFQQAGGIGSVAIESQAAAGIESDERVATEVFAALDGLEEKGVGGFAGQRRGRQHGR